MMVGGDFLDDLDEGLVVGVTPSDFPFDGEDFVPGDPGPVDLNQGPFNFGTTAYERWCYDEANSCGVEGSDTGLPGPVNSTFDLDFYSICFAPNGGGFSITSADESNPNFICNVVPLDVPTLSEWGLMALAVVIGLAGFMVIRKR